MQNTFLNYLVGEAEQSGIPFPPHVGTLPLGTVPNTCSCLQPLAYLLLSPSGKLVFVATTFVTMTYIHTLRARDVADVAPYVYATSYPLVMSSTLT